MKIIVSLVMMTLPCLATPPTDANLTDAVDRSIKKLPEFTSKTPLYGLAVIGKDLSKQVWMILDIVPDPENKGQMEGFAFIDLNGNRDLTDEGEKIKLTPQQPGSSYYRSSLVEIFIAKGYSISITALCPRKSTHPITPSIYIDSPEGDRFGAWGDQNGDLIFSKSTESAPVLHFDGPKQMGFEVSRPLTRRSVKHWELNAGVGTYGLGKGSFSYQFYSTIPKDFHPTATIEWLGDESKTTKIILKSRC